MAAGRTPQPPQLKLIKGRGNGTDSGGRKIQPVPAFIRLPPEKPEWLSPDAAEEWDRVVPELQRLELIKPPDRAVLAAYCEAYARFVVASRIVAAEGMVIKADHQGRAQRHPALLTAEAASKELRALASEFGLTPSSEVRLTKPKGSDGAEENPFAGAAGS